MHRAAAMILAALAAGCVYLPRTTTVYDEGCQIEAKQMRLELAQIGSFGSCQGRECAQLLVAAGAVAATTAVVSGSIVVTGNVVYWFEKQGRCIAKAVSS